MFSKIINIYILIINWLKFYNNINTKQNNTSLTIAKYYVDLVIHICIHDRQKLMNQTSMDTGCSLNNKNVTCVYDHICESEQSKIN